MPSSPTASAPVELIERPNAGDFLYAWTSVGDYRFYPQFINVCEAADGVTVTVRGVEDSHIDFQGPQASMTLPRQEVPQLIIALHRSLGERLTAQPSGELIERVTDAIRRVIIKDGELANVRDMAEAALAAMSEGVDRYE